MHDPTGAQGPSGGNGHGRQGVHVRKALEP